MNRPVPGAVPAGFNPENRTAAALQKRVSVVVCCYNMAAELRKCLESLRRQTYRNKEIIVVDDASTDETARVVSEFNRSSQGSVRLVSNATNLGVAGSRNVGIRHAKGDIIAFTDADCTVDEDWLVELVRAFLGDRTAAVGGRILDDDCSNVWELSEKGHNYVARAEGAVTYVQGCNMAFNATVLRSTMFDDEIKYGYEEALLCDLLVRDGYQIWYNPRAVVHHKHRRDLAGLLKQKCSRGYSSIWYRKRRRKFPMLKRHFLMLVSLLLSPGCFYSPIFAYLIVALLSAVVFSLVRDEYLYGGKSFREIWTTLPIVLGTELAHFAGALCGLAVFRILGASVAPGRAHGARQLSKRESGR
jgi:glycosyltransferase involved in cell wall biosynthesis